MNVKVDFTLCNSELRDACGYCAHIYWTRECKYTLVYRGKHYCSLLHQAAISTSMLMSAKCQDNVRRQFVALIHSN